MHLHHADSVVRRREQTRFVSASQFLAGKYLDDDRTMRASALFTTTLQLRFGLYISAIFTPRPTRTTYLSPSYSVMRSIRVIMPSDMT